MVFASILFDMLAAVGCLATLLGVAACGLLAAALASAPGQAALKALFKPRDGGPQRVLRPGAGTLLERPAPARPVPDDLRPREARRA